MKIHKDHVAWGGPKSDWYWLYWWNWLPRNLRHIGYFQDWYDGPHSSFGLWFINISWRFPWTSHDGSRSFGWMPKGSGK